MWCPAVLRTRGRFPYCDSSDRRSGVRRTSAAGSNILSQGAGGMRSRKMISVGLVAGAIAAGCSEPEYHHHVGWHDHFDTAGTLHVTDSALVRLLEQWDSPKADLWRVPDLGSGAWLSSPTAGARAADAMMGLPPDIGNVPYWPSWVSILGAKAGLTVYAATDFAYVVRAYGDDGSWGDSIITAPPSWRQARRPERGEFEGTGVPELRAYLGSFNVITSLAAVSEEVLIVSHGRLVDVSDDLAGRLDQIVGRRRASPGMSAASEKVNVYVNGRRLITDAPSPGELLGYGPGRVVFGRRIAGRTGYTLTEYTWQPSPSTTR